MFFYTQNYSIAHFISPLILSRYFCEQDWEWIFFPEKGMYSQAFASFMESPMQLTEPDTSAENTGHFNRSFSSISRGGAFFFIGSDLSRDLISLHTATACDIFFLLIV
ncbi:MAG: hypothetical protein RLZZ46_1759 [Bacteroidota bacterium]